MPDDFHARYGHFSHRELYTMLTHGAPEQVDELVAVWKSMETTMSGLAAALRADLDRLRQSWDSAAGREFDRRVRLIAGYAQTLAEEFAAMQTGLTVMARALGQAKLEAEPPENDHEGGSGRPLTAGTLAGTFGGLVGGVIGGFLGHELAVAERERARARMLRVVCALAAEYRVVDFGTWPSSVPAPPPDTPHAHPIVTQAAPAPAQDQQPGPTDAQLPPWAAHPHLERPEPTPVAITPVGADHDPGIDQSGDWWRGTAPAIVAATGLVAAGGVVAATALGRRGRDDAGGAETTTADVDHDAARLGSDGVLRASDAPVGSELASGPPDAAASGHATDGDGRPTAMPPPPPTAAGLGTPPGTSGLSTPPGSAGLSTPGGTAGGGNLGGGTVSSGPGVGGSTAGGHVGNAFSGGSAGADVPGTAGGGPTGGTIGGTTGGATTTGSATTGTTSGVTGNDPSNSAPRGDDRGCPPVIAHDARPQE